MNDLIDILLVKVLIVALAAGCAFVDTYLRWTL